jgi:hypothetical protein
MDECKGLVPAPILKRIAQLRAEANETAQVYDSVVTSASPTPHYVVRGSSVQSGMQSQRATLHRSPLLRLPANM